MNEDTTPGTWLAAIAVIALTITLLAVIGA